MFNVDPPAGRRDALSHWEHAKDLARMQQRIRANGYGRHLEVPARVHRCQALWGPFSAQRARYAGEGVLVVMVNDATELNALEVEHESLLGNLRDTNRRLSRQVLDAQEAEWRKIAQALHGEIGENPTALKLFAGPMCVQLPADGQAQTAAWIALLDQTIELVHDLSRILRFGQIDHKGL